MTDAPNDDAGSGGGLGAVLRLQIELWLVVLFMALAFGAGILITALYEEPATTGVVGGQGTAGQISAPPLTDEDIQGGLPSGHPDIGGITGATGAGGDAGAEDGKDGEAADGGGK
jgi:hypothetical protein